MRGPMNKTCENKICWALFGSYFDFYTDTCARQLRLAQVWPIAWSTPSSQKVFVGWRLSSGFERGDHTSTLNGCFWIFWPLKFSDDIKEIIMFQWLSHHFPSFSYRKHKQKPHEKSSHRSGPTRSLSAQTPDLPTCPARWRAWQCRAVALIDEMFTIRRIATGRKVTLW